MEDRFQQDMQV